MSSDGKAPEDLSTKPSLPERKRKYPSFNVLVNPLFPCIPCENLATILPPLRNLRINENTTPTEGNFYNYEETIIEKEISGLINDEIPPFPNIDGYGDIADEDDPNLKRIMKLLMKEEYNDKDFSVEPGLPREDPDGATDFLCGNKLIACFLAAASTAVNDALVCRIVRNFPTLVPELFPNPEQELKNKFKIFKPEDLVMLTSAFLDQYEDNASFDGPLCSTEVEILQMSQNIQ